MSQQEILNHIHAQIEYCKRNRAVPEMYICAWSRLFNAVARYLTAETAAQSITYDAIFWLDNGPEDGTITFFKDRDRPVCQLAH